MAICLSAKAPLAEFACCVGERGGDVAGDHDLDTGEASPSQYERSDVTALPAAGVIAEAMVALVLADALLEKLGGDSMAELRAHFAATLAQQRAWPGI